MSLTKPHWHEHNRHRRGSGNEPCGPLYDTYWSFDFTPLFPQIVEGFHNSSLATAKGSRKIHKLATSWFTESKALRKSMKTTPTPFPLSIFNCQASLKYISRASVDNPFLYLYWFLWSTFIKWGSMLSQITDSVILLGIERRVSGL